MSWDSVEIGELVEDGVADIQTGPFGTQLKASDYIEDGVPVINVRNIGYSELRPEKIEFISDSKSEKLSVHKLEQSDIVFGRKGAVDRHLFVQESQMGWVQGSDCIRLRFDSPDINPRFISYSFLSTYHKQWMLNQCGNKATMASLNQDVVKRIKLKLPSKTHQDIIVDMLACYDDLIENNKRRIELLEESARQLYKEWFVRFRFPGHEHVKIVDGVPEGWDKCQVGDLLTLQRGFDLPVKNRIEGSVPIYASTGINGYHNQVKVKAPGIVTGRSGSLGTVLYVSKDYWPLNTALWVKEFKKVTPYYALFFLRSLKLENYNGGAAVPTLNRNDVHRIETFEPPEKLLEAFTDHLSPIFKQIDTLVEQNSKLSDARDLLLPKLMNGEIAV